MNNSATIVLLSGLFFLLYGNIIQSQPTTELMNRHMEQVQTVRNFSDDLPVFYYEHSAAVRSASSGIVVGNTVYDLQTNGASSSRIYRYLNGEMAVVWTISSDPYNFNDRGTGYAYYNGTSWGALSTSRIETRRTGWPCYAPLGLTGELIVCTWGIEAGLLILTREIKGTGSWTERELALPPGVLGLVCPRVISNGPDRNQIHILAVTSSATGIYQGLDGAILYTRSLDGGLSWADWQVLPGMTASEYLGFREECYAWAEPVGNTIAFTYGYHWYDQTLMKSTDNGSTWSKTIIWPCPYNKFSVNDSIPSFYCSDGSSTVFLDNTGKAHVAFGLLRAAYYNNNYYRYPNTDGIIYWNESMPQLPPFMNPDSLLASGNFIGWVQDTAVWSHSMYWPLCHNSLTCFPAINVDWNNNVFVIWSSITEHPDEDGYLVRHLYARASTTGGASWQDTIVELTGSTADDNLETTFPSLAYISGNDLDLIYHSDQLAGSLVLIGPTGCPGQHVSTNNQIIYKTIPKDSIICPVVSVQKRECSGKLVVEQNIPNPFNIETNIRITLPEPSDLSLSLYSPLGVKIQDISKGFQKAGSINIKLNDLKLSSGIYFFQVNACHESITKKMVVN